MNMGGIAVYTAMPKGGLKTRPYSVNGTINTNLPQPHPMNWVLKKWQNYVTIKEIPKEVLYL